MNVAFPQPGTGNAHETGAFLKVRNGRRTDIAHGSAQAADHNKHNPYDR